MLGLAGCGGGPGDGAGVNPLELGIESLALADPGAEAPGLLADARAQGAAWTAGQATHHLAVELNLDARSGLKGDSAFDIDDPGSYHHAVGHLVHGSQGEWIQLMLYFRHSASHRSGPPFGEEWQLFFSANGVLLDSTPVLLRFDAQGVLATDAVRYALLNLPALPQVGGPGTSPLPGLTVDLHEISQFGAPFQVAAIEADGYPEGLLLGSDTAADGRLTLRYSNGQQRAWGGRRSAQPL